MLLKEAFKKVLLLLMDDLLEEYVFLVILLSFFNVDILLAINEIPKLYTRKSLSIDRFTSMIPPETTL